MHNMKTTMTLVFTVLANCALALTETIDGVTWQYYIDSSSGGAVIEHPNAKEFPDWRPPAAVSGDVATVLSLPSALGGAPVSKVGLAAVRTKELNLSLIVIPETVKTISSCSFVGGESGWDSWGKGDTVTNPYRNTIYWSLSYVPFFFLGDSPRVVTTTFTTNKMIGSSRKYYEYSNCLGSAGSAQYVHVTYSHEAMNKYVVEGTAGWEIRDSYSDTSGYSNASRGWVRYGAAKVNFEPADGVLSDNRIVVLTSPNSTAKLYYTTDGSQPTTNATQSCHLYVCPIAASPFTTIKALAYVKEYPYTVTYSNTFALGRSVAPSITAVEGTTFNYSGNNVTLFTETDDAEIHYTLDGSEPTENSKLYTGPFTIDDTTTIKAKAFRTDWFDSETATATFTREWHTVEAPIIAPTEAEFANVSQEVSIVCATDGAAIYYTTDGSDPAENGLEYKRPFTIYKSCIVKAIAKKYDWKDSADVTATFTRAESLSEAANCYGYKMETGADASWVVDDAVSHDGISSVRSGGDGSYLQMSVRGAGTLSFWWRAQCEEPGYEYYDYGCVKMGSDIIGRIAGEDTGWEFFSTKVASTAKHVFRWEYHKDEEGSYLPDCIWVDQVQWVPADGSGHTLTTPEPVPYAWLDQYNLGIGTDYETAGNAASGKMNWGKPSAVWEEYVAGLDPTDANSRLVASIEMRDGAPFVSWTPDLNTNGIIRTYKVYGSETLENGGNWQYPTNSLHRFFRVKVEMP